MLDKLQSITKNYLDTNNTDYAILINGPWGSGKTFYLKKKLIPYIQSQVHSKENGKDIHFNVAYISLYGLTNASEIGDKIIFALNPGLKKVVFTAAGFIGKIIESNFKVNINKEVKSLVSLYNVPKSRVLIFDDLERVEANTMNEVLGFINNYTEHENLKVIIVANEQEILNAETAAKKSYERIKEKLIRFTYFFESSISSSFPLIIGDFPEGYRLFLQSQIHSICDTFKAAGYSNLRTLKFIFDTFHILYKKVKECGVAKEAESVILTRFLYSLCVYSIEYKKNQNEHQLALLADLSYSDKLLVSQFMKSALTDSDSDQDISKNPDDEYKLRIEETYLRNRQIPFYFYDWMVYLTHSGDVENSEIENEVSSIVRKIEKDRVKPEYARLTKLRNGLVLENSELKDLINDVIDDARAGSYELIEYPDIFVVIEEYSVELPGSVVISEQVIKDFMEGMKKSARHSVYVSNFRLANGGRQSTTTNAIMIKNYAIELNDLILVESEIAIAQRFAEAMVPFNEDELTSILKLDDVADRPFLHFIDAEFFYKFILSLRNVEKKSLYHAFQGFSSRYVHYNPHLRSELGFFIELKNHLDRTDEELIGKILCGWFSNLCSEIIKLLTVA